tara:strand:- start:232 stop:405 length:174 start_codon:yes stop_codon:yes gene_type:complete
MKSILQRALAPIAKNHKGSATHLNQKLGVIINVHAVAEKNTKNAMALKYFVLEYNSN